MPSVASEAYRALRHGAAVIRRVDRGQVVVEGPDRADFLQGLLTNDVAALRGGSGCYAAYLTPQGRMVADMDVFSLPPWMLLDVDAAVAPSLAAQFDGLIFTEEASVADWSATRDSYGVHGPQALDVAAGALERLGAGSAAADVRNLRPHGCLQGEASGAAWIAARGDSLGLPGVALIADRERGAALRAALLAAGGQEIGPAAAEAVRIESGRPAFPADMDNATIPLEAGIEERALSQTKGCYVGQEVIVRILHRGGGRVARRLVGLLCDSPDAPPAALPAGRLWSGGEPVGQVTSAVVSPALGSVIALGYVPRALSAPGTQVDVDCGDARTPARVVPLPFVDPATGRAAEI